jgi:hypothetical protein
MHFGSRRKACNPLNGWVRALQNRPRHLPENSQEDLQLKGAVIAFSPSTISASTTPLTKDFSLVILPTPQNDEKQQVSTKSALKHAIL